MIYLNSISQILKILNKTNMKIIKQQIKIIEIIKISLVAHIIDLT